MIWQIYFVILHQPKMRFLLIKMKKILLLLLVAIASGIGMQARELPAPTHKIEKMIGKVPNGYNFWLCTPPGGEEDPVGKPLVVFLHGRSLCGNNLDKVKKYGSLSYLLRGKNIDAYVIAPQNPGESWKPEKVWNTIDYVLDECNVDTTRIYVLGMSLGGYGTLDVAAAYPDRIAAAVAMCGGATMKDLSGLADMPLWIIHGTGDASVSVSQSDKVVEAIRKTQRENHLDNRLTYDRVPGMNHSRPARLFCNMGIYDWLFQHSLDDEGRPSAKTKSLTDEFWGKCYN